MLSTIAEFFSTTNNNGVVSNLSRCHNSNALIKGDTRVLCAYYDVWSQ